MDMNVFDKFVFRMYTYVYLSLSIHSYICIYAYVHTYTYFVIGCVSLFCVTNSVRMYMHVRACAWAPIISSMCTDVHADIELCYCVWVCGDLWGVVVGGGGACRRDPHSIFAAQRTQN